MVTGRTTSRRGFDLVAKADRDEFFPDSERVIYDKSPLQEVIFQIRYPTILRIEAQSPADFQDSVRHQFPVYEQQTQPGLDQLPPDLIKVVMGAAGNSTNHRFLTADRTMTIALAPDALAVTSANYVRWENFEKVVNLALEALVKIYSPSFGVRTGLRYRNAVVPSELGFNLNDWASLVSESVVGELGYDGVAAHVIEATSRIRVKSESSDEGVLLQHGIGKHEASQRPAYIFDIDCYLEKQHEISAIQSVLRRFNARARYAFRWCISDQLHEALGPRPVT